jgi:hypothetical protein
MEKFMSRGKWLRIEWSERQIELMKEKIHEADARGGRVMWSKLTLELAHPVHAIRAKAWDVRCQMRREEAAIRHREVLLLAADIRNGPPRPLPHVGLDHRISTTKFSLDADMRGRIQMQGVTAGLLGDPAPGRSALDRKRAQASAEVV